MASKAVCLILLLHRAVADTENLDKPLVNSLSCNGSESPAQMDEVAAGRATAEMRRREVKAVTMRCLQWYS